MTLTIGSLFAGYGGLDMGIASAIPARTAWVSEIDPGACKVLAHRYPDVPGVTRNEALRMAGNGVVPQQAAAALRIMLSRASQKVAAHPRPQHPHHTAGIEHMTRWTPPVCTNCRQPAPLIHNIPTPAGRRPFCCACWCFAHDNHPPRPTQERTPQP